MRTKLIRENDRVYVVDRLETADTYWSRLKGLIGRTEFSRGEGLLFPRCNSVHMWMMSIPIDVVFLEADQSGNARKWTVGKVFPQLKPWKLMPVSDFSSQDVLELPSGTIEAFSLKKGDVLCIDS